MKSLFKLAAVGCLAGCLAAVLGVGCAVAASFVKYQDEISASISEYPSENHPVSGMAFSTEYVVEEYEYDDAYCLLYDDADANLFECEIIVDLETYQLVHYHIENNRKLVGSLVLNDDYSYDGMEVYTFISDPEFEMAAASAVNL